MATRENIDYSLNVTRSDIRFYPSENPVYTNMFFKALVRSLENVIDINGFITVNIIRKHFGKKPVRDEVGLTYGYTSCDGDLSSKISYTFDSDGSMTVKLNDLSPLY